MDHHSPSPVSDPAMGGRFFLLDLFGVVCSAFAWTLATWGSLIMFLVVQAFYKTTEPPSMPVAALVTARMILLVLIAALLLRWASKGVIQRRRWKMLLTLILLVIYVMVAAITVLQGAALAPPAVTIRQAILTLCVPATFGVVIAVGLLRPGV